MTLPIWVSGFNGSMPDVLTFLINGSPDCCPELGVCFDRMIAEGEDVWDMPGADDLEVYQGLNRKKFWQPLENSQHPDYIAIKEIFGEATQLSQMLKNDTRMIADKASYEHYASRCAMLPSFQKYHAMQIRTANLDDAVNWIPGSKAVWAAHWFVNNPTVIYNWTDMCVRTNMVDGLGKVIFENETSIHDMSDWPPETGNTSNGYITEDLQSIITSSLSKHIFVNLKLWADLKDSGVNFIPLDQYLHAAKVMEIYDVLEIAPPEEAWVMKWMDEFKSRLQINTNYIPDLDIIKEATYSNVCERIESSELMLSEKTLLLDKFNSLLDYT